MRIFIFFMFVLFGWQVTASPVSELLDRIDRGASKKFKIELQKGDSDFLNWTRKVTGWS